MRRALLFASPSFQLRSVPTRNVSSCIPVSLSSNIFGDLSNYRARPPIVICHGLFGQKQNWNSVAKAMQRRLGSVVYSVDLRNHGSSPWTSTMTYEDMAADVALFIENIRKTTGFNKINLLGHSMGGKVAMRLAVDPIGSGLIDKLIIEDVSQYIKAMKMMDMNLSRKEILEALKPVVPELSVRQFLVTNLESSDVPGMLKWKCNLEVIDQYIDSILGFTVPVGSFRGLCLFVSGEVSGYVPDSDKPMIRCLFPQVKFEAIPKAGHWIHAEQPTAFIESIQMESGSDKKLLSELRVTELRQELEKRSLDKNGIKIILADRLEKVR
uniref:sn-1-specific diacylglycerol lipase ABHD11 n=1 Tax=Heterorhabditis bacteriophora TaxID=37862 RepID=A0A1I7XPN7_HETBA